MSFFVDLLLLFFIFLISAALVILVIGPLIVLQPERRRRDWYAKKTSILEPRDAGLPQENVVITTTDGKKLLGWLVARNDARGTIFYLHGVGDCKIGGLQLTKLFYDNGYTVLLYDSRAHGESEGDFCTYGYREKHDVSTAISYLEKRTDLRPGAVGLFGTSMGAAIAIQAAAIDSRIKAVVSEACFTDFRTIVVDYQQRIMKLPWHFLRNVALSRSQKIAQFKARDVSPLNDVKRLHIPILFVHGTNDTSIKYDYSKILYEAANQPKDFLFIEGANHNDVWETGGNLYRNTLLSFFDRYVR